MNLKISQNNHNTSPHRVLVIDDDPIILENMNIYLSDNGYKVYTAVNGAEGLISFDEVKPELVICNLRMPDIDGLKLIESFHITDSTIPIIIISGSAQIKDVVEALRLGAIDYLVKPITDFHMFDSAIESALLNQHIQNESVYLNISKQSATNELTEHLKILNGDQAASKRVQLQLLPESYQKIGNFTFQHTIIPSPTHGGDFLDYFEIDDNFIGFYIADISGHGESSAFATMLLKSLINHPLRQHRITGDQMILNPDSLLGYLNQELLRTKIGKHITFFYAVINQRENTLKYCLAGHFPKPVLLNGGEHIKFSEEGFPIGLFEWAEYEQYTIKLTFPFVAGLFSDGLLDLYTEEEQVEKEAHLVELCKDENTTVASIVNNLCLTSNNIAEDDITIFLVQNEVDA